MAGIVIVERAKETTTTTGPSADYVLDGPATGFKGFEEAYDDSDHTGTASGKRFYYCATDGTEYEVGIGTLTISGTTTLARDTIIASSNAGAQTAVNWGAGPKDIFVVDPATRSVGFAQQIAAGFIAPDASGTHSLAAGHQAIASATYAVAIGKTALADGQETLALADSTATGFGCFAGGGAVNLGDFSIAYGDGVDVAAGADSVCAVGKTLDVDAGWGGIFGEQNDVAAGATHCLVAGLQANAHLEGMFLFGGNQRAARGDRQFWSVPISCQTTGTGLIRMGIMGGSNPITLVDDHTYAFEALISARRTDTGSDSAAYHIRGAIKRGTGVASVALVGTPVVTVIGEDDATWIGPTAIANTTFGSLRIDAAGDTGKTIQWMGRVDMVETG